jgi:hypothetical protein
MTPHPRSETIALLHLALTDLTVAHTVLQLNHRWLRARATEQDDERLGEIEAVKTEVMASAAFVRGILRPSHTDAELVTNLRVTMDRLEQAVERIREAEQQLDGTAPE